MKNLIIIISSLFFVLSISAKELDESHNIESSADAINVLTMNIHCFKDDWEFRLSHILTKVSELSPDVIAFQEVCENLSTKESQIDYIKKTLLKNGYPIKTIEAQFTHPAWDLYNEYIVLISKKQVLAVDKGFLPKSLLQRGFVGFNISNRWYINTHLEFRADNFNYRKMQIEFITNRFYNQAHLVAGDFNSSPEDIEQNVFKKKNYNPYFPGPTHVGDDGNSADNIDGFWFSPVFHYDLTSISGAILFKEKINDKYLSDHFAVITHLEF